MISASWQYFWPSIGFLGIALCGLFGLLLATNLVAGLLAISLYGLIPKTLLFDSVISKIRNPVVEEHLQSTFRLHVRDPLPSKSIFVWQPHGLVSVSSVLFNTKMCTADGYTANSLVTLPLYFYIPVVGDFLRYVGAVSSDYTSMQKVILDNRSISVMLGGVREMITTPVEANVVSLTVSKRTGIFRMALETGTPMVPVLTYGENERFPKGDHWLFELLNGWLYEMLRLGIPFPSWTAIQNWSELSYKPLKPIHSYTGKPIQVEKIENPTDSDINALRKRYIEGVWALFKETAPPDYSLEIL